MLNLDVLLHHVVLDVHHGHGDEGSSNEVDIGSSNVHVNYMFEFCVKNLVKYV